MTMSAREAYTGATVLHAEANEAAYTRTAVLMWVNDILSTAYPSFTAVPATELALILHGIFAHNPHARRHLTLHMLDFRPHASPTACMHNVQHVLRMIHHLSADSALAPRSSRSPHAPASATGVADDSAAVSIVGPHLTAVDWMEGRAFVEELKVWRWVRVMAQGMQRSAATIRQAMSDYLHGTSSGSDPKRVRQEIHTPEPMQRSTSPVRHRVSETEERVLATRRDGNSTSLPRSEDKDEKDTDEESASRRECGGGRRRVEHAVYDTTVAATAAAAPSEHASSVTASDMSVTLNNRITDGSTTGVLSTTRRVGPREMTTHTPVLRSDGAERAPALYSNLVTATQALRAQLMRRQAECTSPTEAEGAVFSGGMGAHEPEEEDAEKDAIVRTLEVRELSSHLQTLTEGGAGIAVPTAEERGWQCQRCPVVFAHALQCNLALLEEMEQLRKSAIAACVKKDTAALLTALKGFV